MQRCSFFFGLLVGCIQVTEQPHLEGQDVHLTVLHTADLHSRIFPYQFAPGQIDKGLGLVPSHGNIAVVGGAARIATVVKRERAAAARTIHVDSGDIFQGAPVFNVFGGEAEMRAWSQLGVTAMALGNHEFDRGAQSLSLMKAKFGNFPILAANYIFTDPNDPTQPKLRRLIAPFTIVNAEGLRIGIIGMGNLSSLTSIVEGGNSLGIRPVDATQAMKDTVRVVRPLVDLLIVLSHMGLDEDEAATQTHQTKTADMNEQVAVDGVDVIFGGHLHIVLNPPKDLPRADEAGNPTGHTVLCHSGAFGKYVGRLDLVVHVPDPLCDQPNHIPCAKDKAGVRSYTYKLVPIDDTIPEDPEMAKMLEPYQLKMNLRLNLTENYAVVPCPNTVASSSCPKVVRADPDGGDSQLGNLVAASMRLRRRVEADFGLTNSLGIRTDFESGALNLEQMYNVFPFDNTITTMYLSGDEISRTLDFLASKSGSRGCKSQAQVSGLWFLMDCARGISCGPFDAAGNLATHCSSDRSLDGLPLIGDDCINRGLSSDPKTVKCVRVLPTGEYRAAVNDYIAAGGSGFTVFKNNTTKSNTGISLRDALIDYIRQIPSHCDPAQNQNIVYNAPSLTEPTVPCTKCNAGLTTDLSACKDANAQATTNSECGPGHVCPSGTCLRHYDYSQLPCLDFSIQSHDGRIGHSQ